MLLNIVVITHWMSTLMPAAKKTWRCFGVNWVVNCVSYFPQRQPITEPLKSHGQRLQRRVFQLPRARAVYMHKVTCDYMSVHREKQINTAAFKTKSPNERLLIPDSHSVRVCAVGTGVHMC